MLKIVGSFLRRWPQGLAIQIMHPQLGLTNEVGMEILDFEIVNRALVAVRRGRVQAQARPGAGDNVGADAQLASGRKALIFDIERMLCGRLDDLAARHRQSQRRVSVTHEGLRHRVAQAGGPNEVLLFGGVESTYGSPHLSRVLYFALVIFDLQPDWHNACNQVLQRFIEGVTPQFETVG